MRQVLNYSLKENVFGCVRGEEIEGLALYREFVSKHVE